MIVDTVAESKKKAVVESKYLLEIVTGTSLMSSEVFCTWQKKLIFLVFRTEPQRLLSLFPRITIANLFALKSFIYLVFGKALQPYKSFRQALL